MTIRICVYAIALNEEKHVERFCESAKEADLILIADTGSTDKTVELAHECKATVHNIWISPWRFDLARNAALAIIPADIDVCVSLDLDEILQPGWRQEIERVWEVGKTTRLRYMFNWGGPVAFKYEKIHARYGYRWHHSAHEYPMPYGIEEVWADTDFLMVVHKADPTKSRAQYLPLLKMSVEEDPHCPRNAFYYARELTFTGQWEASIREADRYLALPRATWHNERAYARRVQGGAWKALGNLREAEKAFMAATMEAPDTREPWCELARLMYERSRWPECYAYAMRCLAIRVKELVYTVDPSVWSYPPHLYACIGAWNIGLRHEAMRHGVDALAHDPGNELLKNNVKTMQDVMFPTDAILWAMETA